MGCVHHPSTPIVVVISGQRYCAKCVAGMKAAATQLDPHVTPPDCFVWYRTQQKGGSRSPERVAPTTWPIS